MNKDYVDAEFDNVPALTEENMERANVNLHIVCPNCGDNFRINDFFGERVQWCPACRKDFIAVHDYSACCLGESPDKQQAFGVELTALLNRYSLENDSNTPDFVLAAYLISCLQAFNASVKSREVLASN